MNQASRVSRGFTIVELLIVIVVIAILAAITIVAFNGVQARAHDSAMQSELNAMQKKIEIAATTDNLPTNETELLQLIKPSAAFAVDGPYNLMAFRTGSGHANGGPATGYVLYAGSKSGKVFTTSQGTTGRAAIAYWNDVIKYQKENIIIYQGYLAEAVANNDQESQLWIQGWIDDAQQSIVDAEVAKQQDSDLWNIDGTMNNGVLQVNFPPPVVGSLLHWELYDDGSGCYPAVTHGYVFNSETAMWQPFRAFSGTAAC